jgi:hypothetical protein
VLVVPALRPLPEPSLKSIRPGLLTPKGFSSGAFARGGPQAYARDLSMLVRMSGGTVGMADITPLMWVSVTLRDLD